jgi:hypothetical protein
VGAQVLLKAISKVCSVVYCERKDRGEDIVGLKE